MSIIVLCVFIEMLSCRGVCGLLTAVGPRNIASASNSTVTFGCKTNSSSQIRWQYVEQGSKQSFIIYNGVDFIVPALAERLTVNHVLGADAVASSLTFTRVEISDSGTYQCLPMRNSLARLSFELIVLVEPVCDLRTSSGDSTVRTTDIIEVWCRVSYSGNWAPVIKCIPDMSAANVSRETSGHSVEFYIRIMVSAVPRYINRLVFTCAVGFEGSTHMRNIVSGSSDDLSPPSYTYTWMSHVLYIAGDHHNGSDSWRTMHDESADDRVDRKYTTLMITTMMSVGLLAVGMIVMAIALSRIASKRRDNVAILPGADAQQDVRLELNGLGERSAQAAIDTTNGDTVQQVAESSDMLSAYEDDRGTDSYEGLGPEFIVNRPALQLPSVYDGLGARVTEATQTELEPVVTGHQLSMRMKGASMPMLATP